MGKGIVVVLLVHGCLRRASPRFACPDVPARPVQFNATLARLARDLMPYVLAMHLGMACVMLGNEDILVTDNLDTSAISDSRYATYTQRFVDFMQRFTRIHTLPLFVFLVLVLLVRVRVRVRVRVCGRGCAVLCACCGPGLTPLYSLG